MRSLLALSLLALARGAEQISEAVRAGDARPVARVLHSASAALYFAAAELALALARPPVVALPPAPSPPPPTPPPTRPDRTMWN